MKYLFSIAVFGMIFLVLCTVRVSAEEIYTTEKLITVDTGKQLLSAWDGGQVVFQFSVSTGLIQTPTIKGKFKIYTKIPVQDMRGYSTVNGKYFHSNVPYVMYFYQGYGLHGTYWHNNFGTPMSNGCVNLSIADAEKLYNWADVGMRVVIY